MRIAVVIALVACERSRPAPPPPPVPEPVLPNNAPVARLQPIERIPGLDVGEARPKAKQDCRISQVLRRRFAGQRVKPCGVFPQDPPPSPPVIEQARQCIGAAIASHEPFVIEQELHGTDSLVASATIGVVENGVMAVYKLHYDGDPCGGSCPDQGLTRVYRCRDLTPGDTCAYGASEIDCRQCRASGENVETCVFDGSAVTEN